MTQTIIEIWREIVGLPPDYFTVGSSNSIQWNYGELLEYGFVCILCILAINLFFKMFFALLKH